jgi:nitroreductase
LNAVIDAISTRRSIRRYQERPVEPTLVRAVLAAAIMAPSAVNMQPWSFVVIQDPERRRQLAGLSRFAGPAMRHVAQAPVVVAVLGDTRASPYVDYDCALAAGNLMLAAHSLGLGTCWVGAFDPEATRALLAVPDPWKVVALITLGYPQGPPPSWVRVPLDRVLHRETFGGNPGFSLRRGLWSSLGKLVATGFWKRIRP